jgi:hypothetical protein
MVKCFLLVTFLLLTGCSFKAKRLHKMIERGSVSETTLLYELGAPQRRNYVDTDQSIIEYGYDGGRDGYPVFFHVKDSLVIKSGYDPELREEQLAEKAAQKEAKRQEWIERNERWKEARRRDAEAFQRVDLTPLQNWADSLPGTQNNGQSAPRYQGVDMKCKSDCLSGGYNHQFCNSRCSY